MQALNLFEQRRSMAQSEEEVQALLKGLKKKREQLESFYQSKLDAMMACDVDNSGTVSWTEFLCAEAYEVLKNRSK
jgi:hypothetical protein